MAGSSQRLTVGKELDVQWRAFPLGQPDLPQLKCLGPSLFPCLLLGVVGGRGGGEMESGGYGWSLAERWTVRDREKERWREKERGGEMVRD